MFTSTIISQVCVVHIEGQLWRKFLFSEMQRLEILGRGFKSMHFGQNLVWLDYVKTVKLKYRKEFSR
jgi:hypothetical protein